MDPHAAEWTSADGSFLSASVSGKTPTILLCPLPRRKRRVFLDDETDKDVYGRRIYIFSPVSSFSFTGYSVTKVTC